MPKLPDDDKKRDEALKRALQMKPQKHGSKIDKPPAKKVTAAKTTPTKSRKAGQTQD